MSSQPHHLKAQDAGQKGVPKRPPDLLRKGRRRLTAPAIYLFLLLIILVAVALRFWQLDTIPPGLTHDEADFSHDAIGVYRGARPLYVATYGYQDEPFMHYASALTMAVLGPSYVAVRATSALLGVALVGLTYLWAQMALGRTVALGAAAWLATSYWPVATSRFALQVEPTASLAVLANLFFWKALGLQDEAPEDQGVRPYWALFALSVAASLYAYEASRITWLLYPLFSLYLLLLRRESIRRQWWKLALALLAAGLLALPLLTQPAAWNRAGQLFEPLQALRGGSLGPLLANVGEVAGMFTFRGDPFVTYNLPGRPILDPLTGLFFFGGLLLCLVNWRRPAYVFVVLWLAVGVLPSVVTELHSASLRSIVAQPAVYLLPALAFKALADRLMRRFDLSASRVVPVGLALVLGFNGALTYRDYFVRWARAPETKGAYFSDVFQALRHLGLRAEDQPVVISSPFPNLPHDPYLARVMPSARDLALRWVDGRRAWVFPAGLSESETRLLALSRAPLAPLVEDVVAAGDCSRVPVQGTENFFDLCEWEPGAALGRLRATYAVETEAADGELALPVDFGHAVQLLAYGLDGPTSVAGETLQLVTLWRVLSLEPLGPVPADYYGYDAAVFVHLLDDAGQVVIQEDRLDAPAWNWRRGELFVQLHRLTLPAELAGGRYGLEIGLYTRPEIRRLTAYVDGEPDGDHILLKTLEVLAP